jgi:hypothetical protein
MKGTYPVAINDTIDAASTAGIANCSPDKKHKIKGVATA